MHNEEVKSKPVDNPTLFQALGEETGITSIVQTLFELGNDEQLQFTNTEMSDKSAVFKYSLFITSLIDERWKWFHLESIEENTRMLVPLNSFDKLKSLFAEACIQNNISQYFTRAFLSFLQDSKRYLVQNPEEDIDNSPSVRSQDLNDKLNMFITKFLEKINTSKELQQLDGFKIQEREADIIERATKVLHSMDMNELELD